METKIIYSPNSNVYTKTLERTIKSTFGFIHLLIIAICTFFQIIALFTPDVSVYGKLIILVVYSIPLFIFILRYNHHIEEVRHLIELAKYMKKDVIKKSKMYTHF